MMPSAWRSQALWKTVFAVAGNVFGEADGFVGVVGGEDGGEEGFAFAEGEVAGIVAVEVEEVEDEVGEGMGFGVLKGGLEVGEAGVAVGGEDDDFAVEGAVWTGRAATALAMAGMRWVQSRPLRVRSWTLLAGFAGLDAVAVELELVDPVVGVGGGGGFEGELRGDEVGLALVGELVEVDGGASVAADAGLFGAAGAAFFAAALGAVPGVDFRGSARWSSRRGPGLGDLVDGAAGDGGVGALVGDGGSSGPRSNLSCSLMRSQLGLSLGPWAAWFMRMRAHLPFILVPCMTNLRWPSRRQASTFSLPGCGPQVPWSQIMTVPPPYWPSGMMPSKPPYSMGWSSTWTARRRSLGL